MFLDLIASSYNDTYANQNIIISLSKKIDGVRSEDFLQEVYSLFKRKLYLRIFLIDASEIKDKSNLDYLNFIKANVCFNLGDVFGFVDYYLLSGPIGAKDRFLTKKFFVLIQGLGFYPQLEGASRFSKENLPLSKNLDFPVIAFNHLSSIRAESQRTRSEQWFYDCLHSKDHKELEILINEGTKLFAFSPWFPAKFAYICSYLNDAESIRISINLAGNLSLSGDFELSAYYLISSLKNLKSRSLSLSDSLARHMLPYQLTQVASLQKITQPLVDLFGKYEPQLFQLASNYTSLDFSSSYRPDYLFKLPFNVTSTPEVSKKSRSLFARLISKLRKYLNLARSSGPTIIVESDKPSDTSYLKPITKRLKIALCISGQLRSFEKSWPITLNAFKDHDIYPFVFTWANQSWEPRNNNIHRWLPRELINDAPSCLHDLEFIKTYLPATYDFLFSLSFSTEAVNSFYDAKKTLLEEEADFEAKYKETPGLHYNNSLNQAKMFYGIHKSSELAYAYAEENDIEFDIMFRLRHDADVFELGEYDCARLISSDAMLVQSIKDRIGDRWFAANPVTFKKITNLWKDIVENQGLGFIPGSNQMYAEHVMLEYSAYKSLRCDIFIDTKLGSIRPKLFDSTGFISSLEKDLANQSWANNIELAISLESYIKKHKEEDQ